MQVLLKLTTQRIFQKTCLSTDYIKINNKFKKGKIYVVFFKIALQKTQNHNIESHITKLQQPIELIVEIIIFAYFKNILTSICTLVYKEARVR